MMKNVKLDIAKTGIEISADIEAKAQAANALLHSGNGAGNDFLGWVHLPSSISENEIDAIRKEAAKLRSKADVSSASASAARTSAPRPCSKP